MAYVYKIRPAQEPLPSFQVAVCVDDNDPSPQIFGPFATEPQARAFIEEHKARPAPEPPPPVHGPWSTVE